MPAHPARRPLAVPPPLPPIRRAAAPLVILVLALALAGAAALPAQGTVLPAGPPRHEPLNPYVAARSGLFVPGGLADERPAAGWRGAVSVEYGSAVERNLSWPDHFLLDAELLRVQLRARRGLGRGGGAFVELEGGVSGAAAGFADGFFERYHQVIRWVMEERDVRPRNQYGDRLYVHELGIDHTGTPRAAALGDSRVTVGLIHGARRRRQTLLSATLPTAPAASSFARGTATVSLLHGERWAFGERAVLEGSAGVGYSPRHGPLAPRQRTVLHMASLGAVVQVRGPHALYATAFHHAGPYRGLGFPELEKRELSADFGYLYRTRDGRRWRVGLTEDTRRRDPGIDLVVKVSVE